MLLKTERSLWGHFLFLISEHCLRSRLSPDNSRERCFLPLRCQHRSSAVTHMTTQQGDYSGLFSYEFTAACSPIPTRPGPRQTRSPSRVVLQLERVQLLSAVVHWRHTRCRRVCVPDWVYRAPSWRRWVNSCVRPSLTVSTYLYCDGHGRAVSQGEIMTMASVMWNEKQQEMRMKDVTCGWNQT